MTADESAQADDLIEAMNGLTKDVAELRVDVRRLSDSTAVLAAYIDARATVDARSSNDWAYVAVIFSAAAFVVAVFHILTA
jgi:ABC-type transporter Mla subunit MlaD